jgi:eukaryotic-like serine/threonine-protein kinase
MSLTPGTKLGPYEVIAALGAGGMGEVYRAKDTRLGREVAIKVLPEALAKNAEGLSRFEHEAKALGALNHPNLMAIYDVGSEGGVQYIVSELLEGKTLRERLYEGALPQRKVVEYSTKVTNGLAAAHEKGIVHRDLKPENIFVTNDEQVKILDFGLAKYATETGEAGVTVTLGGPAETAPGTVMGTVGYMSPEQVRGLAADSRSDIFSLGTILYEMATGKRAFTGDSAIETMNAILKSEPAEIDFTGSKLSPGIDRILRHCLEKNPTERFRSARDLGFALTALSGTEARPTVSGSGATVAVTERNNLGWMVSAGLGALVAAIAGLAIWNWHKPVVEEQQSFAIPVAGEVNHLALSADGKMLAYTTPDEITGKSVLVVQQVGKLLTTMLKGTEGASYPFWSPDDKYVGFLQRES